MLTKRKNPFASTGKNVLTVLGALIIFADDAEYVGTNGWFRLKYQNQPDHVFERCPDAREKLVALIRACNEMGGFATFDEACNTLPPLGEELTFDDDSAWHGAKASTWAETPMARLLRPWQDLVRQKLRSDNDLDDATRRRAWSNRCPGPPDLPRPEHPRAPAAHSPRRVRSADGAGGGGGVKMRNEAISLSSSPSWEEDEQPIAAPSPDHLHMRVPRV